MALNWKRAAWRKLYITEQGSFALLPALVRGLAGQLIKVSDDHGVIPTGGRTPAAAVAILLRAHPAERRLLPRMLDALVDDGYLIVEPNGDLRIRNLVPAQTRWDKVRGEHTLADERTSGGRPADTGASPGGRSDVVRPSLNVHPAYAPNDLSRAHDSRVPAPLDPIRSDKKRSEEELCVPSSAPAAPESIPPAGDFDLAEGTNPGTAPRAKRVSPPPDPDAFQLADELREAILANKPNHRVGEPEGWTTKRRWSWARRMAKAMERRPKQALQAAIRHLAEQTGGQYDLIVEAADSFVEKLDRIEVAMGKARSPARLAPPSGRRPGLTPAEIMNLDMSKGLFGGDR